MRLTELDADGTLQLLNKRALVAKVAGLDELPQWKLIASGEMSVVGPRPLLQESIDLFSNQAEKAGVTSEEIEEWRMFLRISRPGLFGKSQALRHKRSFDEGTQLPALRS